MKKLTLEHVQEMREARRLGATITALADQYGVLPSTIRYHTRDVTPQGDGQKVTWVTLDELLEWLPALPWQGLPLPTWFVRSARLDWRSIRERLSQPRPPEPR